MSLHELQHAIREGVLDEPPGWLLEQIDGAGLRPEQRLQIYRNNTRISLVEALKANFPVVARLVGDGFFGFAADRFLRAEPPRVPCLAEYGSTFPGFLARFEPAANLPYLADVARLEWAIDEAVRAPDEAPLDPSSLAAIPKEQYPRLRFALQASVRFLSSPYPVKRIWLANQPGAAEESIDLDGGGGALLVMRRGFDAALIELEGAEHAFLVAIEAGNTIEAAFAEAATRDPAFDLAAGLARQFQRGSLARLLGPLELPVRAGDDALEAGR